MIKRCQCVAWSAGLRLRGQCSLRLISAITRENEPTPGSVVAYVDSMDVSEALHGFSRPGGCHLRADPDGSPSQPQAGRRHRRAGAGAPGQKVARGARIGAARAGCGSLRRKTRENARRLDHTLIAPCGEPACRWSVRESLAGSVVAQSTSIEQASILGFILTHVSSMSLLSDMD
jgi:hypothetical protein